MYRLHLWQNNTFEHICTDCKSSQNKGGGKFCGGLKLPRYEQFSMFVWTQTSEPFETLVIIKVLFWHLCVHFAFNCVNLRKLKSNLDPESLNLLYHSHICAHSVWPTEWLIYILFLLPFKWVKMDLVWPWEWLLSYLYSFTIQNSDPNSSTIQTRARFRVLERSCAC